MSAPSPMMLNPFIFPPLIEYSPLENPCVMSCGWMYGATSSGTSGPSTHAPVRVALHPERRS